MKHSLKEKAWNSISRLINYLRIEKLFPDGPNFNHRNSLRVTAADRCMKGVSMWLHSKVLSDVLYGLNDGLGRIRDNAGKRAEGTVQVVLQIGAH